MIIHSVKINIYRSVLQCLHAYKGKSEAITVSIVVFVTLFSIGTNFSTTVVAVLKAFTYIVHFQEKGSLLGHSIQCFVVLVCSAFEV